MSVDERVILFGNGFDARSRGVNGSRGSAVEGQPRERLDTRWQIMMFAAGRVSPALRGRKSSRTNDRSRPTARRTSSGRARGSRASNSDKRNLPRPAVFLGGYGRFVAVTAEAFAASRRSWRRSLPLRGGHGGGLLYIDTKTTQKIASHATSAFFITGTCLGFAPHRGTCAARRIFRRNHRKKKKKAEKATSTGRGRMGAAWDANSQKKQKII